MSRASREKSTGVQGGWAALGALALILLGALVLASPASAATPSEAEAPLYETPEYQPEPMVVGFAARAARISGPGAIVSVRCSGTASGSCDGTLSLRVAGDTHKVPYTIAAGERRIVVVPLGDPSERPWRQTPRFGVAVTRTVQPLGGLVRSARQLRLR